jgi:DNA-binding NtrC family response regulator
LWRKKICCQFEIWNDFLIVQFEKGNDESCAKSGTPFITRKNRIMKEATPETKAKKVLIVEDEGDMCLLLNILLNGKDMELDHVQTLLAADEYLQKELPSVMILDNKLPDGFGIDFISYLKDKYPSIKIIMISGFDASARDVALENGADVYLEKPFTKDQLYNSIKELIN